MNVKVGCASEEWAAELRYADLTIADLREIKYKGRNGHEKHEKEEICFGSEIGSDLFFLVFLFVFFVAIPAFVFNLA